VNGVAAYSCPFSWRWKDREPKKQHFDNKEILQASWMIQKWIHDTMWIRSGNTIPGIIQAFQHDVSQGTKF